MASVNHLFSSEWFDAVKMRLLTLDIRSHGLIKEIDQILASFSRAPAANSLEGEDEKLAKKVHELLKSGIVG